MRRHPARPILWAMAANIRHSTDASFEQDVLSADVPVLVDFWAEWCGPCRAIAPHLESIAPDYEGKARIVKLDIDENPSTPQSYGIRSIPTLLVFKGGKVVDQIVGNPGSAAPLRALLDRNL
jgi:thioredoxin 1